MPLTEEGNYIHEEDSFKCNACGCYYPLFDGKLNKNDEYVCKECLEEENNNGH